MADHEVVVVGGGPAGMMAGYLFARAGIDTLVLEKHGDFLRDFRGDTVHPSTLDLFDELGLLDRLLERPHDRVTHVGVTIGERNYRVADFRHLPSRGRFIAMMPQWEFLDFLAGEARCLPSFALTMQAEAIGLMQTDERVAGVRLADGTAMPARLVIVADGRESMLRTAASLPLEDLGAPIDVLWFRVPKHRTAENATAVIAGRGDFLVTIDRGDYWQCARVIRKGGAETLRALGLDRFRADVVEIAPHMHDAIDAVRDWDDVKLLSVTLDRLRRWHRPGLLAIGDAAHAMSPVGGVGINLAIQDAVAAANILAGPMRGGADVDALLPRVQARRHFPVGAIQALQRMAHRRVLAPALEGRMPRAPLILRLLDRAQLLQRIPARIVGLGFRREHIRSPKAAPR